MSLTQQLYDEDISHLIKNDLKEITNLPIKKEDLLKISEKYKIKFEEIYAISKGYIDFKDLKRNIRIINFLIDFKEIDKQIYKNIGYTKSEINKINSENKSIYIKYDKINLQAKIQGFESYSDKLNHQAQEEGFKNLSDKLNHQAQEKGFKNLSDKRNNQAQEEGFKNNYDKNNFIKKIKKIDYKKIYLDKEIFNKNEIKLSISEFNYMNRMANKIINKK